MLSAVRCIRKFDGCSKPGPPIARPSAAVSDGEDLDFIAAHPVDQAERKAREDVPPDPASMTRPPERVPSDGIDCVPQLLAKAMDRKRVSSAYQS